MSKSKKLAKNNATGNRAGRGKLTSGESLRRMQSFDARKEQFIAAIRKGKNRSISA